MGILIAMLLLAQGDRGGGEDNKPKGEAPKCDLKKTEKGKFCETCVKLRAPEDLGSDYWTCKECSTRAKECDVCVKEVWECPECRENTYAKEGTCTKDSCKSKKPKLEKKFDKARVYFKCKGTCMQTALEKKRCLNQECSGKGKDYERTCDKSGSHPHLAKKK
jgi:hypothetical protein